VEKFAHDGHLTATAGKTRGYLPYHWYLVAIETAFSPGDPDIIPGDDRNSLEPLLRVYEGCARAYLGEVEGATLIKLHRHSGKVSYLVYPEFDTDPHPALLRSIKLSLRTRELDCHDYATSTNPPILHRKETFLPPGHPLVAKFARLTRQEEKHGLLDETASIGTRAGWQRRLAERGFQIRGHRLIRRRSERKEKDEESEPRN